MEVLESPRHEVSPIPSVWWAPTVCTGCVGTETDRTGLCPRAAHLAAGRWGRMQEWLLGGRRDGLQEVPGSLLWARRSQLALIRVIAHLS